MNITMSTLTTVNNILAVEISHISNNGIWLLAYGIELCLMMIFLGLEIKQLMQLWM